MESVLDNPVGHFLTSQEGEDYVTKMGQLTRERLELLEETIDWRGFKPTLAVGPTGQLDTTPYLDLTDPYNDSLDGVFMSADLPRPIKPLLSKPAARFFATHSPSFAEQSTKYWCGPLSPALTIDNAIKWTGPEVPFSALNPKLTELVDEKFMSTFSHLESVKPLESVWDVRIPSNTSPGVPGTSYGRTKTDTLESFTNVAAYVGVLMAGKLKHVFTTFARAARSLRSKVKARAVVCPDAAFHVVSGVAIQPVNDLLSRTNESHPIAIGSSIVNQGAHKIATYLDAENPDRTFVTVDVSDWDANMFGWLFSRIIALRYSLLNLSGSSFFSIVSPRQWYKFLCRIYHHVTHDDITLGIGRTLKRSHGMTSGFIGTGHDDSLGHLWAFLYALCLAVYTLYGMNAVLLVLVSLRIKVAGDDLVASYRKDFVVTEEQLQHAYSTMGMVVGAGKVACSVTLEGLSWCSKTFRRFGSFWVFWRHPRDLVNCLLYPEWRVGTLTYALSRMYAATISFFIENPFDRCTNAHAKAISRALDDYGIDAGKANAVLRRQAGGDPTFKDYDFRTLPSDDVVSALHGIPLSHSSLLRPLPD